MTLVSVIVPAWNAEQTIQTTLQSVAGQSFADYEVLIIDDGSTDGTAEMARAFCLSDRRFRLIQVHNGGPSRARNLGARQARGTYLAFLDADDLWAPTKLEQSVGVLRRPGGPAAVYGRTAFFRNDPSQIEATSNLPTRPLTPLDLLGENPVCTTSNIVVSADEFRSAGGFAEGLNHAEDVDWLIRLAATGRRIEAIDDTLVFYRTSDAGLSADIEAMHQGWKANLKTLDALGHVPSRRLGRRAEAVHLRYLARRALRVGARPPTSMRFAFAGLFKSPIGFFSDLRRGGLTLLAALAEPLVPPTMRRALFR